MFLLIAFSPVMSFKQNCPFIFPSEVFKRRTNYISVGLYATVCIHLHAKDMLAEFVPCFTTMKCKRLQFKQVAVSHSFITDIKLCAFKLAFIFLSFYICNTHIYIILPKLML